MTYNQTQNATIKKVQNLIVSTSRLTVHHHREGKDEKNEKIKIWKNYYPWASNVARDDVILRFRGLLGRLQLGMGIFFFLEPRGHRKPPLASLLLNPIIKSKKCICLFSQGVPLTGKALFESNKIPVANILYRKRSTTY